MRASSVTTFGSILWLALGMVALPEEHPTKNTADSKTLPLDTATMNHSKGPELNTSLTPRDTMGKHDGINCKGSRNCHPFDCCASLIDLLEVVENGHNEVAGWDTKEWKDGEKIACVNCHNHCKSANSNLINAGLCLFPQALKDGAKIDGITVRNKLHAIVDYGCEACGSVPLHDGQDVSHGMLTANYVALPWGCPYQRDGLC